MRVWKCDKCGAGFTEIPPACLICAFAGRTFTETEMDMTMPAQGFNIKSFKKGFGTSTPDTQYVSGLGAIMAERDIGNHSKFMIWSWGGQVFVFPETELQPGFKARMVRIIVDRNLNMAKRKEFIRYGTAERSL